MSGGFTERTGGRVPDNKKIRNGLRRRGTRGLGRPGPWEHGWQNDGAVEAVKSGGVCEVLGSEAGKL